ncbi:hypothetical protein D3C84_395260 [compost metagenome]
MNSTKNIVKLDKKIRKWIFNWISTPTPKELFLDEPTSALIDYLNGQDISHTLGDQVENLATWYLIHYESTALNQTFNFKELANASFYYGQMLEIKEALADSGKGGSILPAVTALSFSLAAISGWKDECALRFSIIKKGLDTPLLNLKSNENHQTGTLFRHFWFLLELYAKSTNKNLDTSLYSYPAEFSPYQQVINNWNTEDQTFLQVLISSMADFHLSHAKTPEHDDVLEFDYEERMLLPYEILAFLRIREWADLKNPSSFDHPLMQHPLAQLPATLVKPNSKLFNDVIDKFKKEFPSKS